jgi:hypothetical protein
MMWPFIIGLTVFIWGAIDLYCYLTPGQTTLSRKVVAWTRRWPLLPFILGLAVGILAGHFWPISLAQ